MTLDGRVVLFGGNAAMGAYYGQSLSDTWTWDGAGWTEKMIAGPSPRAFAAMAAR
jgi:hypothetical protein